MLGYAVTNVFEAFEVTLLQKATVLVADLPDWPATWLRCHELARAIATMLDIPFSDGRYGHVEHSWCWTRKDLSGDSGHILDVYAVGSLPQVQLIDYASFSLPHFRNLYVPYAFPRKDIDSTTVDRILTFWGFKVRPCQTQATQ